MKLLILFLSSVLKLKKKFDKKRKMDLYKILAPFLTLKKKNEQKNEAQRRRSWRSCFCCGKVEVVED